MREWVRNPERVQVAAGWPLRRQTAVMLLVLAGYVLTRLVLGTMFERPLTDLAAVFPVIICAWLFGLRGGLFASVMLLPIHTLLLNAAGAPGWDAVVQVEGGPGSLTLVLLGLVIGRLRELEWRISAELRQRVATEKALETSEARLRNVVTHLPIVVFAVDRAGRVTLLEGKVLAFLGYDLPGLIGRSIFDVLHDRPGVLSAIRRALAGEAFTTVTDLDGLTLESWYSPQRDERGNIIGAFGAAADVTDLKRTERALRAAKEAAEAANRAKSTFLANMSHELRTPLATITGYSEMLQEQAKVAGFEQLVPLLRKIDLSAGHLLALISNILDLSKVEAGRMELACEHFDVGTIVEEVVAGTQPLIIGNGNEIVVTGDQELGSMFADPIKLRQILLNLLSNAAKFTEKGRITLRITRAPRLELPDVAPRPVESLRFEVCDTGIGISAETQQSLFQPFVQADASTTRRYGGTGLGLAISRRYCHMMGGEITLHSALGQGATFVVTLPAHVETQAASPGTRSRPAPVPRAAVTLTDTSLSRVK